MRRIDKTWTMAAADDDAICLSQTPGAAGALTINGVLSASEMNTSVLPSVARTVAVLDVLRYVLVTAAADESGKTFILVATDNDGNVFTESMAGPNTTTKAFINPAKKIISVSISDAAAGAIKIGTNNSAETAPIRITRYSPTHEVALMAHFSLISNITWQWQSSNDDPNVFEPVNNKAWFNEGNALNASAVIALNEYPRSLIKAKITGYQGGSVKYSIVKTS